MAVSTTKGIEVAPESHIGVGIRYRAVPFLRLRLSAAKNTDGFQLGGGFTLGLGPVHLSFAGAVQKGYTDGSLGSFSLSFGGL